MRSLAPLLASLALFCALGCAPEVEPRALSLLSANVGNTLLACEGYAFKLCQVEVEERIAERIAELSPDVIALQEAVGLEQCAALDEEDPAFTCHDQHTYREPAQVRRLVGKGYAVACADRDGYDCVAVKRSFGAIRGCDDDDDEPCLAETAPVVEGCDPGFSLSAVDIALEEGVSFRLVNAHPQSGFETACRAAQLEQLFDDLAGPGPTLIAGDLNLDPFEDTDESVVVWDEHVGEGKRFRYHSGEAEHRPPYPTSVNPLDTGVLDHVVSDFLEGSCVTLGEAPGSAPLDGGEGMDHRALRCGLSM